MMETPFLEIPEEQFLLPADWEDDGALELFDISYLRGLTETAKAPASGEKYIVFTSGEQVFGVSLKNVTEVCRSLPVTILPGAPEWLAGVANLRGDLLAVIDPDTGVKAEIGAAKTKIIVLTDGQKRLIGLLADQVNEITLLPAGKIDPAGFGVADGLAAFACGSSTYRNSSLTVLDTGKIFSWPELSKLSEQ